MNENQKRFRIAFSFAGEKRKFVEEAAAILAERFGKKRILYDKYHESEFSRSNLAFYLPDLYKENADLVVAVFCPDYDKKEWCGLEWSAIYALVKERKVDEVMLTRFERVEGKGLHGLAGYTELDTLTPAQFAQRILERLAVNEGKTQDFYTTAQPNIDSGPLIPANRKSRFSRILMWLGLVVLTLLVLLFWGVSHQRQSSAFRVVVAEIDGPDKGMTGTLIQRLRNETQKFKDVLIVPSKQRISVQDGSAEAARLAARENADLVIWGRNPASSDFITLYFEPKQQHLRSVLAAGTEGVTRVYPEGQLGRYDVQQRLSSEVSSLALFIIALAKMEWDDERQALDLFNQIIEKTSSTNGFFGYAEVLFERARCYDSLGSNCSVLISELSRVIKLNTNFTDAYLVRAETYRKCRKFDECIADSDHALRLSPGHGLALVSKGSALAEKGNIDGALRCVDEAVRNDPSVVAYSAIRAHVLAQSGRRKEAIEECTKALERDPRLAFARMCRGIAYSENGDFEQAIADLTKAMELTPRPLRRRPESRAVCLVERGMAYTRRAIQWNSSIDLKLALADYDEAEKLTPKNPWVYLNRGVIYHRLGKLEMVVKDMTKV